MILSALRTADAACDLAGVSIVPFLIDLEQFSSFSLGQIGLILT